MTCVPAAGRRSFQRLLILSLLGLVLLSAAQAPPAAPAIPAVRVDEPVAQRNLAVYLLHGPCREEMKFITLQQGLASGQVAVSEQPAASVRQLRIENRSDSLLFLQEGDRLKGGQQDRTCSVSYVVGPRSGAASLPAFCVEPGRWRGAGASFGETDSAALAPQSVRLAAKVQQDQHAVWNEVGKSKRALADALRAADATTSLNETYDDPNVRAATAGYVEKLGKLPLDHRDVIGVAFAVDGRLEEVDIYPNHELLMQIYPKLLGAHAVDAAVRAAKQQGGVKGAPEAPGAEAVRAIMAELPRKLLRDDAIDATNRLAVADLAGWFRCLSTYRGEVVHAQWLRADPGPAGEALPQPLRSLDSQDRLLQRVR